MPAATLPRIGAQEPRILVAPPATRVDAARDVIDMAEHAGIALDPWQCNVLRSALSERDDGKWAAFEVALVVPRRNGKSALIEALILAALFIWRERTVIYSCHRFDAAQETFMRLRQLIEMSDFADEVAKIYTANGKEAIILKSGCRVKFMARSRGTGRGFDGDRIILDEAYDLAPMMLGAMVPTMAARSMLPASNPQIWYASSAPHASSLVLHSLRQRALDHKASDPTRLAYLEWSAPEGTDNADVEAWYLANPAMGIRIAEDYVRDEMLALSHSPDEFARERLGIPDPLPSSEAAPPHLDPVKWEATRRSRTPDMVPGEVVFGFDVHDGWSSIVVAGGSLAKAIVWPVEHRSGAGWLPGVLVDKAQQYRPAAIGCDGGNGANLAAVAEVREALEAAGLDPEIVKPLTTQQYKAAAVGFVGAVDEGTVDRPRLEADALQAAGEVAPWRTIGDSSGCWNRQLCPRPIAPLVAATVARALLPEVRDDDAGALVFAY